MKTCYIWCRCQSFPAVQNEFNSLLPTYLHILFLLAWTVLLYAQECLGYTLQSRKKKSNCSDRLHGVALATAQ